MFHLASSLFSNTKSLENKIDNFHNKLIDVSLLFKKIVRVYLEEQRSKEYRALSKQIKHIEHEADKLRRDIENNLYSHNLIPDLRADVLELVENLDKVINRFDEVAYKFYIERPEIPAEHHARINELCDLSAECAENMAKASRAFFRDRTSVRDYSEKVYFIEHESDLCSGHLREAIFDSDIPLANKLQLSSFINEIADISDIAEDFIDNLLIFTIKRDI